MVKHRLTTGKTRPELQELTTQPSSQWFSGAWLPLFPHIQEKVTRPWKKATSSVVSRSAWALFLVGCHTKRSDYWQRWESPPSTAIHTHSYEVSRGDGTGDRSVRGAWLLVHDCLLLNAGGRLSGPCSGTLTSSSGHPAVPQQCFHFCPFTAQIRAWLHSESSSLKEKPSKAFSASLERFVKNLSIRVK